MASTTLATLGLKRFLSLFTRASPHATLCPGHSDAYSLYLLDPTDNFYPPRLRRKLTSFAFASPTSRFIRKNILIYAICRYMVDRLCFRGI
jgi:hypothetical protein